jgi:acetyltransferase-like isoleucine patch superfamily enzyme
VTLVNRLHRIGWLRRAYRFAAMAVKRRRYGLRNVHSTFYMAGRSDVSGDLVAHEYSFINQGCYVGPRVELGRYVMLGPRVAIVGGDHRFDRPGVPMVFAGRPPLDRTVLEADVWVGFGAVLRAGVRIGRGAIVAAGAVVTRDVPPYEVHGGVPARKIGERFPDPADRARHDAMLDGPPAAGKLAGPLGEA